LVKSPSGLIAGVTWYGGDTDEGVAYTIDEHDNFSLLHMFSAAEKNILPKGLVFNGRHLYGITMFGGDATYGTIFKLRHNGTLQTIYNFSGHDAALPEALLVDENGDFVGVSNRGGEDNVGNIFRATKNGDEVTVIHEYSRKDNTMFPSDVGLGPNGLIVGSTYGSDYPKLVPYSVFSLDAEGNYKTLHVFDGDEQRVMTWSAPVVMPDGTLYGTTFNGGSNKCGSIYKITPEGNYSVVYSFGGDDMANQVRAGLTLGSDGNLYGTAESDSINGYGMIYRFLPRSGQLEVLYYFDGTLADPQSKLVERKPGVFYGTTYFGGENNLGAIFKIKVKR
jgi:uncharacterized repeat protein (TIGR03803 family)